MRGVGRFERGVVAGGRFWVEEYVSWSIDRPSSVENISSLIIELLRSDFTHDW